MRKSSEVMAQIYSKKNEEAKKRKRKTSSEILAERNINFKDIKQIKDTSGLLKGTEAFKGVTSAFDDGWDFGDITKTAIKGYKAYNKVITDTTKDLATDIGEGFLRTVEGVADAAQYGLAWGFDQFGADKPANWLKENAEFDSTGAWFGKNEDGYNIFSKGWTEKAEKNSIVGDFGDSVAQGVGNVAAFVGLGALTGGGAVSTALTSFASGYGNARSEAYKNGADDKTSHTTGLINGFAEAISEQFFNGIPGMKTAGWGEKLTGKIGGGVAKYFGTNTGKTVMKVLDVSGEGFEEVISNVLTATGNDIAHYLNKNFTYGMEGQSGNIIEDIGKQLTSKETWSAFLSATLTSAIVNGGNTFVSEAQKNSILKSYAKDNGITVEEAKAQLEKTVNAETKGTNLPFGEMLKAQDIAQSKQLEYMKKGIFVEQGQKDQAFQYKETDNEQVNKMLKNLSEKSNNSVENHATANMAEKLIRDLGYDVEFVTSEELKALNRPENAAGYKEGNKVVLNLNSNELASFVMGHETTHFLEQEGELYDAVSNAVFELAKTRGKYDGDVANLSKTYEKVISEKIKSEEAALGRSLTEEETAKITEDIVKSELTANYVGNFFTDEDFFKTLGKKNPGMLQKFSEFLKKLYYQVTGQEEKAQILKAQQTIRKVYQEYANSNNINLNNSVELNYNQAITEEKATDNIETLTTEETTPEVMEIAKEKITTEETNLEKYLKAKEEYENNKDISKRNELLNKLNALEDNLSSEELKEVFKSESTQLNVDTTDNTNLPVAEETSQEQANKEEIQYLLAGLESKQSLDKKVKYQIALKLKEKHLKDKFIWALTGWNLDNIDGNWKYEIADATLKKDAKIKIGEDYKLKDCVDAKELFKAYPQLKDYEFSIIDMSKSNLGENIKGMYAPSDNGGYGFYLNKNNSAEQMKETLAHEIQHAIQEIEGFASGSSKLFYKENGKILGKDISDKKAYDMYKNTAGEVESRNVANRTKMSALERKMNRPNATRDIADKDIIKAESVKKAANIVKQRNNEVQYSLTDNQGRELSKEQQEYFKDSKAIDESGNLKVLYHGTPSEFNKFSYEHLGTNGTLLGKGFYLTDDINVAKAYANKGENGKVMELYTDIKKPLKWGETTISKQQYKNFVEAINEATEGRLFADYSGEFSEKGSKQYNSTLNDILMDYEYGGDDIDLITGILNTTGMAWDKGYKILKDTTGYDGIIVTTDVYDSGEGNVYIPFQSSQIKNVDNVNPTTNEDIRYSLSEDSNYTELNNILDKNNMKLRTNGSLEYSDLTDSQIKKLAKIYQKNGYSDVSIEYLEDSIKNKRAFVPREVTDEFIKKVLKYEPNYDTTKIYEDAEGNKLTKEQVEFYKDSGVRDIRGRLIPVYHRTDNEFTVFDNKASKRHGKKYGDGFYFSITPENYGNIEMKVYLNAKEGEYKYVPSMGYYIVQEPNQIKNVDNTNPTDNPDIRYTLDEKGKDYALYTPKNQFKNKLSDGLLETEENLPVAEENLPYTEPEKTQAPVEETTTEEVDLGDKSVLNNTINKKSIKAKEGAVKAAKGWLNLKDTNKQEFKDSLDKFTRMTQEELLTTDSYEEIRKIVDRYSENEIVYTQDDVKEIKSRIRNAKIKVTDDLKAQITDYGYFRKSNMGKLRLGKTGTYIDVLWKELSEMYPHHFDSEVLAESDMLYALSEFMNEDFSITEKFTLEEEDITEITNDVFDTILENALNKKQIEDLTAKDNELKKMNKVDVENIRTAESVIGTQEDYISTRADELFNELKGLKKGIRASSELSQILNLGYRWSDIKAALSNIKWKPGMEVNSKNTNLGDIESTIKSMIDEEYQNKVQDLIFDEAGATGDLTKEDTVRLKRFNYAKEVETLKDALESTSKELDKSIIEKQAEYDSKKNKDTATAQKILQQISALKIRKANIELDYNKRIGNLTEKIKNFDVKEETRRLSRAEYKRNLSDEILPLIENASKWKDKKLLGGFRYSREVAQRNMVDVAGDIDGNAINEYVFNPVQENEASKNRRIKEKFQKIRELELDLKQQYEIDGEKVGEDDLVRRYIENSINKIELDQMGVDSNKIIQAADTISDMLESMFTDLNSTLKKMGLPEVEHRKDYFPHGMEDKQDTFITKLANMVGIDITNQELPTEIAGRTDEFKPNRAWNGHLLRRKGDKTNTDAIGNLEKYIAGVEDIIAHTEDIQKVRTLSQEIRNQFTSEETQAKVEAINNNDSLSDVEKDELIKDLYKREDSQLSGLVTWLDDYANILSNKKSFSDRDIERKIGRNAYTSMANIEGIIAANTIGGNASVSLTNFAPIVQALATTKGHNLVKASLDVMKNDIKALSGNENNAIKDMSDFLTNRFGTEGIGRKTWKDKIKNIAFKPMEIVDNFTSEVVVRAKYYENLQNGMDTYEAMKKADRDAARIMADRSKGAMPTIFNEKNPLSKLITMFQVEPNNIISNYTKDMSRDAESKGQLAYQYTKLAVGSYVFNSILMGIRGGNEVLPDAIRFVQYLIQAITGDDDEREKAGTDMLEAITGAIPFVSNVAGLLGMEDVGRIPISSALPDLTELVNLTDDEVSSEYKWQVARDEILKPLSYFLLPTGAAQVWKTVQGIDAVARGGSYKYTKNGELKMQFPVEDANVIDYAKAGLFGKYSLDEAKTYIDSGFKSLTEKQAQAYEELNLPYADYLEYLDGITNAKNEAKANDESQTEAVYDYIYNLPISTDQKNTMLNSALNKKDTITDENGYIKYVNSKNRTYWYDAENDKLYNNNYHEVDSSMINELTQYSNKTDIADYENYGSLEEFNYANNYPEKHLAITQITDYATYTEYKDYIEDISNHYSDIMDGVTNSKQKTAISNQKKQAIRQYIDSLNLNQYQKLMLEKLAGGYSIKNYKSQVQQYINSLELSKEDKEAIDSALFD